MLIPLYVLIGVWGGADRLRATLTFVIYTVVGSLLMLAAIIVYGLQQGTFDLTKMGPSTSTWLFLGFVAAFAIKSPLFPFHGWLPITYRESPPEVSAVLSGRRLEGGPVRPAADRDPEVPVGRRTTGASSCSCSRRSRSSTARCSRSAPPTSAASSCTRRSRSPA